MPIQGVLTQPLSPAIPSDVFARGICSAASCQSRSLLCRSLSLELCRPRLLFSTTDINETVYSLDLRALPLYRMPSCLPGRPAHQMARPIFQHQLFCRVSRG